MGWSGAADPGDRHRTSNKPNRPYWVFSDVVEVLFWDLRRRESPSEKPIMEFPAKKRAIKMEGLMENEFVGIH